MFAPAAGQFLSEYNKKVREGDFLKLITVRIEKQVSGVQKNKEKVTFDVSIWVKKSQANLKKKYVFMPLEVNFVLVTTKRCENKSSLCWSTLN